MRRPTLSYIVHGKILREQTTTQNNAVLIPPPVWSIIQVAGIQACGTVFDPGATRSWDSIHLGGLRWAVEGRPAVREWGAARGLRSPDLQFTKLPLCRAELWRHCATAFLQAVGGSYLLQPAETRWCGRKEKLPRHKDSENIWWTRTTFKRDPTIARRATRLGMVLRRPSLPAGDGRMGRRRRRRGPLRASSRPSSGGPHHPGTLERAHPPRRRDRDAGAQGHDRGARRTTARAQASGPREGERRGGDLCDATRDGDDGQDRDHGVLRLPRRRTQGTQTALRGRGRPARSRDRARPARRVIVRSTGGGRNPARIRWDRGELLHRLATRCHREARGGRPSGQKDLRNPLFRTRPGT